MSGKRKTDRKKLLITIISLSLVGIMTIGLILSFLDLL